MKIRAAATLLAFGFIVLSLPAATAERGEPWRGEHGLTEPEMVLSGTTLTVANGTNVTFTIPPEGTGGSRPFIDVRGSLEVCGTADAPVLFRATSSVFERYRIPACITFRGAFFQVQNASFVEMVVDAGDSVGEFWDCHFVDCDIFVRSSPIVFYNCTFEWACCLNISSPPGGPQAQIIGCRFNGSQGWRIAQWRWGTYDSALVVKGPAIVTGTNITEYGYGIRLDGGIPSLSACDISYCYFGISDRPAGPAVRTEIADTTIENCLYIGVDCRGGLAMRNSTVRGCLYGLVLTGQGMVDGYVRTFSGNEIFDNGEYGIAFDLPALDPGDTVFTVSGASNGNGRMLRYVKMAVNVVDQVGNPVRNFSLNVTDALGEAQARNWTGDTASLTLTVYSIDNSGTRTEHFPCSITASKKGCANRTVIQVPVEAVTIVVPAQADLRITGLATEPAHPTEGERVIYTLYIENAGQIASVPVKADIAVCGMIVGEATVPALAPGATAKVDLDGWRAAEGGHGVRVRVDPAGALIESDRTNNELVTRTVVGPARYPMAFSTQLLEAVLLIGSTGAIAGVLSRRK